MERRMFLGAVTGASLSAVLEGSFPQLARSQNDVQAHARFASQSPFETSQDDESANKVNTSGGGAQGEHDLGANCELDT
jgi:hypothetical protein